MVLLIFVLFGLVTLTFIISYTIPADPAWIWAGGPRASQETIENLRIKYHLYDPLHVQFYYYLKGLLQGDLGESPVTHRPVLRDIQDYLPNTFNLVLLSTIISVGIGIPLGIVSAVKKDKAIDHISRTLALTGVSLPNFWLGLMLQWIFYYFLGWLPATGLLPVEVSPPPSISGIILIDSLLVGNIFTFIEALRHTLMPAVCLAWMYMAAVTRITRSSMLEVMSKEYIRTAKMKGLKERVVVYKHALKNALIPVVTVIGLQFGASFQNTFVVETVFAYPGIGRYAVLTAVNALDYPAIMGVALVIGVIFTLSNLIVDILYTYLNPEVELGV